MNRDDVNKVAEWLMQRSYATGHGETIEDLLAELDWQIAEKIKWNSIHSCHADCQNPACVIVREAVAAEREACAKVAEWVGQDKNHIGIAAAIRARREQ